MAHVADHALQVAADECQGEDCDDRDERKDKSVFNEALACIPAPITKDRLEMPPVHCSYVRLPVAVIRPNQLLTTQSGLKRRSRSTLVKAPIRVDGAMLHQPMVLGNSDFTEDNSLLAGS
jgi:hypothetical protein